MLALETPDNTSSISSNRRSFVCSLAAVGAFVLDNITLYWLTKTAISAGRLYWESKHVFCARQGIAIPVAFSVFPDEIYSAPQSWAAQAYPQLIHYNRLSKGGHFAAWEPPKLFTEEIRASFRMLR